MTASARIAGLRAAAEERILIIDGAMGTMIHQLGLLEADFRGTRFSEHAHSLTGNSDVLVLTNPARIAAPADRSLISAIRVRSSSNGEGTGPNPS